MLLGMYKYGKLFARIQGTQTISNQNIFMNVFTKETFQSFYFCTSLQAFCSISSALQKCVTSRFPFLSDLLLLVKGINPCELFNRTINFNTNNNYLMFTI